MNVPQIPSPAFPPAPGIESNISRQEREIVQAVRAINAAELYGSDRELVFARDPSSGRPVLRVVDRSTREVLGQTPPEYALELARDLAAQDSRSGDSGR